MDMPTANIIFNEKKLEVFLVKSGQGKDDHSPQ